MAATKHPQQGEPEKSDTELRRKLREAYERGATEEATRFLEDEFRKSREAYSQELKALRKQVGL